MDKRLLHKYISGDASEEEAHEVIEWIEQSDENKREYITQRKLFDISIWRDRSDMEEKHNLKFSKTLILKIISMILQ